MEPNDLFKALKEPFDPKVVHWRVGSTKKDKTAGIALAYINARDAMKRLDEVMGLDWQCRYPFEGCCEIGLKIGGEWVWRSNGAGETDIEGEKGRYSDAFKRAAVMWGIGRYLYYLPNVWVPLKPQGKSHVLAQPPQLPEWALPKNGDARLTSPSIEFSPEQKTAFDLLIENAEALGMLALQKTINEGVFVSLYHSFDKGHKGRYQRVVDELLKKGNEQLNQYVQGLADAVYSGDDARVQEIRDELSPKELDLILNHSTIEVVSGFEQIRGISVKIDVTKIDKARLFKGEKGTYLDLTTFIDTDQKDQYDNNGFISQSVTKEEREQNVQTPILGNCKVFYSDNGQQGQQQRQQAPQQQAAAAPDMSAYDDDLPF